MSDLAITLQKERALEVISLMVTERLTQKEACERLDISPRSFQRYMNRFPDLANEVSGARRELIRDQLEKITEARQAALDELASRASPSVMSEMETMELIAFEARLDKLESVLQKQAGLNGDQADDAPATLTKLLTGPQLRKGKATITQTITIEPAEEPIEGVVTDAQDKTD